MPGAGSGRACRAVPAEAVDGLRGRADRLELVDDDRSDQRKCGALEPRSPAPKLAGAAAAGEAGAGAAAEAVGAAGPSRRTNSDADELSTAEAGGGPLVSEGGVCCIADESL